MGRACEACHSSKVKCIRSDDTPEDGPCDRCKRLGIECLPHVSRQGQGPRRSRKKSKLHEEAAAKVVAPNNMISVSELAASLLQQRQQQQQQQQQQQRSSSSFLTGGALGRSSIPRQTSAGSSSVASSSQQSNSYNGLHPAAAFAQQQQQQQLSAAMSIGSHNSGGNGSRNNNNNSNIQNMQGNNSNFNNSNKNSIPTNVLSNNDSNDDPNMATGMASLQVEDEIVCNSLKGMDYNHYGMHHLIRMWVSLSLSRRSFNLLARTSFIAAKCGISMDDVLANKSPFSIVTNTPPMTWLSLNILSPREQQSTLGPRIKLQEAPWDLLKAVGIDLNKLQQNNSNFQRWAMIRWNTKGKCRFWASPFFELDFATIDEIERVWVENKIEVIDLFLPKSEKKKFGMSFFNLLYLNKDPNMNCYVQRLPMKVRPRGTQQTLDCTFINSLKIVDLETSLHYHEIWFEPIASNVNNNVNNNNTNSNNTASTGQQQQQQQQSLKNNASSPNNNKRDNSHLRHSITSIGDPLMDTDLEFTDLDMTDEFEEWMNILDDPFSNNKA